MENKSTVQFLVDHIEKNSKAYYKPIQKETNEILKSTRKLDAEIAVKEYGWVWINAHGIRNILVPPENDPRRYWTAIWDKDGIPHFLPKYSEGEN